MKIFWFKTRLIFVLCLSTLVLSAQDDGEIIPEEAKSFTGTSQWEMIELLQLVAMLGVLLLFIFFRRRKNQDGSPF